MNRSALFATAFLLASVFMFADTTVFAQDDPDLAILESLVQRQPFISLAVYDVDDPAGGVYHNADIRRPLASTMKIMVLAEYAQRVEKQALNPEELVPLDSIEVYFFGGTDGGAHEAAMAALRDTGRLENDEITLSEIAEAMIRYGDNSAADYLILRFGRTAMEEIVQTLGLERTDPPMPINGLILTWVTPFVLGEDPVLSADVPVERAWSFGRRLRSASKFPDEVRERMEGMSRRLGYQGQMSAILTYPSGTTRDFAGLMARILQGTLISEEVSETMLGFLDWPMDDPDIHHDFDLLATISGSMAGILTSAYVVEAEDGNNDSASVLALFQEELPSEVLSEWMSSGAHQQFERRLLVDRAFRDVARESLGK